MTEEIDTRPPAGSPERPFKTEFEYWETDSGVWKATEAASDSQLFGRGETSTAAIANYCQLVEDGTAAPEEVPADD